MYSLNGMCPICGKPSTTYLEPCQICREDILRSTGASCTRCAADLAGSDNPCPACRSETRVLDGLKALGPWRGKLRELVSAMKYGGDSRLAVWLSFELTQIWLETWPGLTLVPVPPRPVRLFRNGFDPVTELVRRMKQRGVPVAKLLMRRGSQTQKSLNREDRKLALNLDYRLKEGRDVTENAVVLFDDISTTGTTLEICAQLLKNAGVQSVFGLIICKD